MLCTKTRRNDSCATKLRNRSLCIIFFWALLRQNGAYFTRHDQSLYFKSCLPIFRVHLYVKSCLSYDEFSISFPDGSEVFR